MSNSRTCSSHPITNIDDLVSSQFGHKIVLEQWPSGKQKNINRLERIMYSAPWGGPSERTRRICLKSLNYCMDESELEELRYWRYKTAMDEEWTTSMAELMEEEKFQEEREEERVVQMTRQARQKGRMSVL